MATKSKNISVLTKIICVLLSVICFAGATHFVSDIIDAVDAYNVSVDDFNGKPLHKSVADSVRVQNLIYNDIDSVNVQIAVHDTKTLKKEFQQYRDSYISTVYSNYIADKNEIVYDDDYYEYFENYYTLTYQDMDFVISIDENDHISYFDDTEESAKEKITAKYDEFLNSDSYENYLQYEDRNSIDSDSVVFPAST